MKHYQVVGFEDIGPVFWFTVTADSFSEALKIINKDQYMTDMTFYKTSQARKHGTLVP